MQISWRYVDSLLSEWADWVRFDRVDGFPNHSPGSGVTELYKADNWFRVAQRTAKGTPTKPCGGHRILYGGKPDHVRITGEIVTRFPKQQYLTIAAWYGLYSPDGSPFTSEQKAAYLGITETALLERLRRARKKFARELEKATGKV